MLHAIYVSIPSNKSMFDCASMRADEKIRCLKCSACRSFRCVESAVTVRMAWKSTGRSTRSCQAVREDGKWKKGKWGSIRVRKNARDSSAWRGDIVSEDGSECNGAVGNGSVAGVSPWLVLGLVDPVEWLDPDVKEVDIFCSPLINLLRSTGAPEEPTVACNTDIKVSSLPSSCAIRASDS